MSYLDVALLGILQGIAEFLPISSSGHLAIAQSVLGQNLESMELNVALHIGTLLSILVVFRRDLVRAVHHPQLCLAIVVATLPLVVVGLLLKSWLETTFAAVVWTGVCLCATALLLSLTRRVEHGSRGLEEITLRDAVIVGGFQAIAPLPGISRSGSTIFGGLVAGLSREAATQFSFLIAIPAILGATVLYSRELLETGLGTSPGPMLLGTVVAFAVGVVALNWLLRIVKQQRLAVFAWYCAVVGVSTILWQVVSWSPDAAAIAGQ